MDALRLLDDERARDGVADDFDAVGPFVVDHPLVLVPKDEIRRHAALPQVARQLQRAPALDVLLRSTVDLSVGLCIVIIINFNLIYYSSYGQSSILSYILHYYGNAARPEGHIIDPFYESGGSSTLCWRCCQHLADFIPIPMQSLSLSSLSFPIHSSVENLY